MGQNKFPSNEEIRCETITDEIVACYTGQGYALTFAEEVMRYDFSLALPHIVVPFEISYLPWKPERVHDFFILYESAFRERPGFPGWSEAEWIRWTTDDPAFRPDLSIVAMINGQATGFVTSGEDEEMPASCGYLIQVGVHPGWRGRRIGAVLIVRTLQMWREARKDSLILHVNVNNPGAIRLYQQLGFVFVRRRGRFTRQAE